MGWQKAQYYISGGYYSEDGILRYADMDFSRYNFAANISSQITDWMKVKVNTKFMHSDEDTPLVTEGLVKAFIIHWHVSVLQLLLLIRMGILQN